MNCVKNEGSTSKCRPLTIGLMGLLVLSLSFSAAQVQSQTSYIIAHALNPEGIEIASIEGMSPHCVEIYDEDTLIGYGAHDNETCNEPIAISPGAHTIGVTFNGIELSQNINLQEGETKILTFNFERTIFDHRAYLNAQGTKTWTRGGLVHGGEGDYMFYMEEICPDHSTYPYIVLWSALHTRDCVVSYSVSCEFVINANGVSTNKYSSASITQTYPPNNPFYTIGISAYYTRWSGEKTRYYSNIAELNNSSFDKWFLQKWAGGLTGGTARFDVQGKSLTNSNGYFIQMLDSAPTIGEIYTTDSQFWADWTGTIYRHIGVGTFTNDHVLVSSVPYDLLGTGIRCEEVQLPVASFVYSPENPVVGEEIILDASASYDPDGEIISYNWNFGDGNSAEGEVVTHAYIEAGEYTVTLMVSDNDGLTGSTELNLEVKPIPVLLVHGYCSDADMWGPRGGPLDFKQALQDQGFLVETIELVPKPTNDSIWNYGSQLFGKITQMKADYEVDQVDIVAHSLGGLAARAYAWQNPSLRDVRTLIMLGTPNNGSGLLSGRYWYFLRPVLTVHTLGFPPCQGFGEAAHQMTPGSPFLRDLNSAGLQPSIENYYAIAGDEPVPDFSWISNWLLIEPHDGVVEVASVQAIPGTTNYLHHVNHFEYDDDSNVFNAVVNILRGATVGATSSAQAQQSTHDYQESALIEDSVATGEVNDHSIPIDSTVSEVRFALASSPDELDFTLTSPGGTLITPAVAASDPLITYTNAITTLIGYAVTSPEQGNWIAHVATPGIASSVVDYAMLALLGSDLGLSILLDENVYDINDPVPLTAQLVNASGPVTEATVVAQVKSPDGSTQSISLYDDGSRGDAQANDGIYSSLYTNTITAGAYEITVTASGTPNGEQFVRETATTIWAKHWTPDDKIVAAYYFYWYDIYTGLHFVDPDGSDALTDHPPDDYLSNYSFTEVAWHRRQLLDMMTAQIDIVLPVYWGSDAEAFWSIPGLQNLVSAVEDLIDEGYTPPKIGMFYDTTALQQQNGGVPPDLTTQAGKALFYSMMADFFNLVPQSLWAMIDGRPILFLYSTEFVGAYDQSTFDYVAQHFQTDFGTTPYIVREASWEGVNTDETYYWGVALNGPLTAGRVGSVGPGFDDTAVYDRPVPRIRDRECGEFYNASWEAMISAGTTLVSIETWNELHEATEIAASHEYSTTYIALTAQNVLRWKATNYSTATLVWVDLGRHSYVRGLRPAFNFAGGDGVWLVTSLAGREAAYPDNTTTPPSYYIYLDVNNIFINATPSDMWVTVEYYDGGTDQWWLEYDSVSEPYLETAPVVLQNTGQWKRYTFHLPDAYFGGRQNGGADLRLADAYWDDGQTNYFGRIWIAKSAPGNQAPDLVGLNDVKLVPGQVVEIPVSATDPDGDPLLLALDQDTSFATLTDSGDGTGTLRLAPTRVDVQPCSYRITVIATDTGSPVLADTVTLRVTVCYDFNGDGQVDVDDIMQVASRWRTSCANPDPDNDSGTPNYEPLYDIDNDCDIDIVDIMLVVVHWGETCG